MSQINSPFKFLDSYQQTDVDVFFGRERETKDLYNALSGVKHLMVYGPSGSGKTSLVECGLRNQFSDADWYALTIRKGADINASVFAGINNALNEKIEIDPVTKMPLDPRMEFGHGVDQLFAERYQPVYLLFDQFEELLISGGAEEKIKFFTLLNKLIRNKVPCRVMLIMREEFIGHLSEFELLCPSIFQHRFRVEKMGRKNVEEVIYKILEAPRYRAFFKVDDSHKLAESILSKLPDKKKEIELAHVQVFLGELWDRATNTQENNEQPLISENLIQDDDNLEKVLESFLKKQMKELEDGYGEWVPLELLAAMISDRFTKLQLSEEAIKTELEHKKVLFKKPIAELLKELEKRRIIRIIKTDDETQYEISHDVLALVVGQNLTEEMKMREKAGDIYKIYLERSGLFSQDDIDYLRPFEQNHSYPADLQSRIDNSVAAIKHQREQERVKTRNRLGTLYGLLGAAVIALLLGGYFYFKALDQTKIAEKNEVVAKYQTLIAELEKNKAKKSDSIAKVDRDNAIKASIKAIESDSLAQIDKENAIKQAITSRSLLLNSTAKDLFEKGFKTEALRVGEFAYSTALIANHYPPNPILSLLEQAFYSDNPIQLRKFKGHTDIISSLNFSPDGNHILTGSSDNSAILWDLNGNQIQKFQGHEGEIYSVAFSPDGNQILTGSSDNTAILWDLNGNPIQKFEGHNGTVSSVAFSQKENHILTGSHDNTAILWSLNGKPIQKFIGHSDGFLIIVSSVVFSPDGKYILTGSWDSSAILWDLKGDPIQKFEGHKSAISTVAFSPEGNKILTGSFDGTAILWDLKGDPIQKFEGHKSAISTIAFSPEGNQILTGSWDNSAILWNLKGDPIQKFEGHKFYVSSVAFSPKGNHIITGSLDKTAILWEIKINLADEAMQRFNGKVYSISFSPDGNQILTGSSNNIAILWDFNGNPIQKFEGHKAEVTSVAFSPKGNKILTGSRDNTAMLWDINGNLIKKFEGHKAEVTSVAFSPKGNKILTGSRDNTAMLWDINGNLIKKFEGYKAEVTSVAFSPKGNLILIGSLDNTAILWDINGNTVQKLERHMGFDSSVAFSNDGNQILKDGMDNSAILWDLKGNPIQKFEGHKGNVFCVAFSPNGNQILTGSSDSTAILWDLKGNPIQKFEGHYESVSSVAFSPDGNQILTGSSDYTAILWDLKGNLIHKFEGYYDLVKSIEFSPNGNQILTLSRDDTAILWKTPQGIFNWLQSSECPLRQLTAEEKVLYGIIEAKDLTFY